MSATIDPESAKSLIQEYQTQNASAAASALKTPDGHNLHGFFIDRQTLENILSNPANVGISINLAKHPDFVGSRDNKFTIVYAGAEPNSAPNPTTPYVNTGDIYADPPPCPPHCATV